MKKPHVVIVGAGFGGLMTARSLRRADVDITLIDKYNYHTFQPLLYQVATSALDPEEVAHSVRGIFHHQKNLAFRLGDVVGIDWQAKVLELSGGLNLTYDYLVLAVGASTNDFGVPGVKEHAFYLKTLPQAVRMRAHIITQFERADADPLLVAKGALTFVLVGGGPTGVEMAGSLVELFGQVLKKDYPNLDVSQAKVILVEMTDRLLGPFHERSRQYALEVLRRRGVEVRLHEAVVKVTGDEVHLKSGEVLLAQTLIWAAGVRGNPLVEVLGLEQTRGARLAVNKDLSLPGHPEVFIIGDLAGSTDDEGNLHPQVAPLAKQGGKHVARQIERRLDGERIADWFVYKDPGIMATISRNAAVAELPGGIRFRGFIAWLAWLFLHLVFLIGFRNRMGVLINWAYSYFTYDRGARLIIDVVPDIPAYSDGTFVKQDAVKKDKGATTGT
ncbi:MAG: NAD(P)/FAD-dependent oxidoreductase [Deinococcota bacterium]|nr:NAD(P)/FAD-dependent oxidoreductase [Deinococcota bacterium]